jgi:hypothetical protein
MTTLLKTATVLAALCLSLGSAHAQYQGSDEAPGNAQSWAAAAGGYGAGGYRGAYAGYYGRFYRRY